jgi:uncharacterized membrane protein YbhN (UPF0104 family)
MKAILSFVLKFAITLGIFVAIFLEFGGGFMPVETASLRQPGAFAIPNPEYPGLVGRMKAKLHGAELPPPRVPVPIEKVCAQAASDHTVFVRTQDGQYRPFKPLKHCTTGGLATVYVDAGEGRFDPVPLADAPPVAYFRIQGFQLVPAELSELWAAVKSLDWSVFVPWFAAAILIKLVGIIANVWRWQILLAGQGIEMKFGFLCSTYFIGRYFGIVTPSTMGLDAWRLYETIRLTKQPVECTTTLVVERVLGLVGLLAVILLFMPFAGRVTEGQTLGQIVAGLKVPIAGAVVFAVLLLVQPELFRSLLRLVPHAGLRRFAHHVIDAITAYSQRRGHLVLALAIAIFGQITTTLMYFANAMAVSAQGAHVSEILFAAAVMTLGTFIAPSASGEGVRELVFVYLLGGTAGAVKAFLIGNLGFWIEKVPLSIPGGVILLMRRDPTLRAVTREDLARVRAEAEAEIASARAVAD